MSGTMMAALHSSLHAWKLSKHVMVDVNAHDNEGRTPLIIVCSALLLRCSRPFGIPYKSFFILCELLKRKEVNVNAQDNRGRTPAQLCMRI